MPTLHGAAHTPAQAPHRPGQGPPLVTASQIASPPIIPVVGDALTKTSSPFVVFPTMTQPTPTSWHGVARLGRHQGAGCLGLAPLRWPRLAL